MLVAGFFLLYLPPLLVSAAWCGQLHSASTLPIARRAAASGLAVLDLPQRPSRASARAPLPVTQRGGGFVFGDASVDEALDALQRGELVLLAEDDDEGAVGSLVVAPELVSSSQLGFIDEHCHRLQVALEPEHFRAVYSSLPREQYSSLPLEWIEGKGNLASPEISVSAGPEPSEEGSRSGSGSSSPPDLAQTVRSLLSCTDRTCSELVTQGPRAAQDPSQDRSEQIGGRSSPDMALRCPGAVPLACGREGGVLRRAGANEASIALCDLAGLPAMGLHATLRATGGDELRAFAARHGLVVSSTADLVAYTRRRKLLVERCGPPVRMPTTHGLFIAHTYRSLVDGAEHMALVKSFAEEQKLGQLRSSGLAAERALRPFDNAPGRPPPLVRVHSECCTGDVFGSLRCDCGPQLNKALQQIQADGWGVLLYLRGQEGRGIGLGAKMHAYALQEQGLDTLDANTELGLPVDSREYGTGAQILADLGISDMRLITNNPKKLTGLAGYGLRIVERVPSHTAPNPENSRYLRTKIERMGHLLNLEGETGEADLTDLEF